MAENILHPLIKRALRAGRTSEAPPLRLKHAWSIYAYALQYIGIPLFPKPFLNTSQKCRMKKFQWHLEYFKFLYARQLSSCLVYQAFIIACYFVSTLLNEASLCLPHALHQLVNTFSCKSFFIYCPRCILT